MFESVNQFVSISPLINPYEEGSAVLKWAIAKQYPKSAVDEVRGRRAGKDGNSFMEDFLKRKEESREACLKTNTCVDSYKNRNTTDFDDTIPDWNMSLKRLKVIYDKARFERYLNWKKEPYIGWKKYCFTRSFKRRIPWLHLDGSL